MNLVNNILVVWKNKGQIIEGIKNSVFKKDDVEQIADYRMGICLRCELFDDKGEGCMVPGTQPCCNRDKGGCGCSLEFKTRALSSSCPKDHWTAVISEQEEDLLKQKLGID
jgi:hypothetical protein